MKVMKVRVTKGNNNFVAAPWVLENAVDAYKEWMTKNNKARLHFEVTDGRMDANENGVGVIHAYTLNGFDSNVRVD